MPEQSTPLEAPTGASHLLNKRIVHRVHVGNSSRSMATFQRRRVEHEVHLEHSKLLATTSVAHPMWRSWQQGLWAFGRLSRLLRQIFWLCVLQVWMFQLRSVKMTLWELVICSKLELVICSVRRSVYKGRRQLIHYVGLLSKALTRSTAALLRPPINKSRCRSLSHLNTRTFRLPYTSIYKDLGWKLRCD